MSDLKTQICDALAAWIRQRPGLEFGNYGDQASYNAELRSIQRDKRDAELLLVAVRNLSSIHAEDLIKAFSGAFSGRLTVKVETKLPTMPAFSGESLTCGCGLYVHPSKVDREAIHISDCNLQPLHSVEIDYCTGQYWPTEYRKAAAAVLARALWEDTRKYRMPAPQHAEHPELEWKDGPLYDGLSAGTWMRQHFRKEFGSRLQKRWFE